ncbi:RHS repeat-associated core domain-containing protein [Listeria ivanovii]|uniref:DNRLRE domain-containing protein n=1 Tax=Listeria ivanovii TaxID=1638 RepID=UPI0016233279|nr:DNRLRE domain-containing protein [Listeria ivanovii]MBC2254423.1 RHS repeat-associated core domain-containing protein [Listeria ivanovii]
MKRWVKTKKLLLSMTAYVMILSLLPAYVPLAEETATGVEAPTKTSEESVPTEVKEERTENEIVYDNHDGSFTKQIFADPINMEVDGDMARIDANVEKETESGMIVPKQTPLDLGFLEQMENGAYQKLTKAGAEVTFRLKGARQGEIEQAVTDQPATYQENEVTYKEVFPKIDLRHLTFPQSVKEDLVLQEPNQIDTYVYQVETKLDVKKAENGDVIFENKAGDTLYTLPKPVMTDSNVGEETGEAALSEEVSFEVKSLTKTVYELQLKVDTEWLNDAERVYPVYIDPSVRLDEVYNANVNSANPTSTNIGSKLWDSGQNAYTLKLGKWDNSTGNNAAFLKMDTSTLNKATISKATLKVYNIWHMSPTVKNDLWYYEAKANWSPWQVTWNTVPGVTRLGSVNVGRGEWANLDVTNTVQAWASGARANYGFRLGTNSEQTYWKKLVASENNKNYPYLEVNYTYTQPEKPIVNTTSNGIGTGTGSMDLSWKAVPGATSYNIVISNGYNYEYFNTGSTATTWSTKGKKIFPTATEIANGEFEFHHDGKGAEFALDPREQYENAFQAGSTFGLRNLTRYLVRVQAVYPGGESPTSDLVFAYMPIEKPKPPVAKAYANLAHKETGYVELNWEKSPMADGYKVLVFNGKAYEQYDVGTATKWTTQNKGIWPTKEEIAEGKFALHQDGNGAELAKDPSPVYTNSGGNYKERQNYWFRVIAYQKAGNNATSVQSEPATPTIPEAVNKQLGMVDYWTSVPVRGGEVNATNGNFLFHETDFELDGRGPSINVNRTFNSQDEATGIFGKGWTSTLEEKLVEEANGDIIWIESDKKVHRFTKKGDKYEAPPGIYSEITKNTNGYLKIEEDKAETRFLLDGRLASEKDTKGNQLTYNYTDGKLSSLRDASGRTITLTYDGDLVTKLVGPDNRTITYTYNDKQELTASSTARGKMYRYGYTDGLLTSIYDPKHTEEKPYETKFVYEEEKLTEITDPVGKKTTLSYDKDGQQTTLTNEKKKQTIYEYNDAGNPKKEIVDADGLKLTTTYTYESNNLTKEVNPKGQAETYTYDADGNVTQMTDAYGTESYTYNNNNDVTSATDTEGRETTIAYDGTDAVSETIATESQVSSVTQYDGYGNPIRGSGELASGGNLVQNSGFENGTSLSNWRLVQWSAKGSMTVDTTQSAPGALGGTGSVKLTSEALTTDKGYSAAIQSVDVEPETTYTLSAWTKTSGMTNADGILIGRLQDANAKDITDGSVWQSNRPTSIKNNGNWVKRQLTFKTTKNTRQVLLYLDNEQPAPHNGKGTVWYDNIQFEKGSVASSYNPVVNSSVENHNGTLPTGWMRTGNTALTQAKVVDNESFSGDSSVYFERKATSEAYTHIVQDVPVNQKVAKALTLTALSKSEDAKSGGSTTAMSNDYSIWGTITYQDGTTSSVQGQFPLGTNDWNRSAVVIKPTKPIKMIKAYTMFRNGLTGKAWFDDIRVMEGEVLTKDEYDAAGNYVAASYDEEGRKISFTYDNYGNTTSETDEKGNKKTLTYDADNALIDTKLANGTSVAYKYDDNGNTTEKNVTASGKTQKNSYEYDVDNKITSFTDALNRTIKYEYDAAGNETKAIMPNGRVTESTYDSADRMNGIKWNDEPAFKFQYDPNGNQTKVTDEINGLVTDKTYDDANRITKVAERSGAISYTYKDKPTADNKGKTDKVGEVAISHGSYTAKTSYTYNDLDQNTRVNDGSKNAYFEFDEFGNVNVYTAGNGSAANYTYDSTQKVTNVAIGSANGTPILDESYTYDAASNRTSIDNKQDGKTTYEYDAVNQLTKETLPNGTVKSYTYDGFGNRTQVAISGNETKTIAASYNDGNQLVSWNGQALTYDTNGNRTSDGKFTYTWDTGDRLINITKKDESKPFTTYTYDDDNRRLSKTIDGVTTNYHYDGDSIDVLYETDGDGKAIRQYVYSDDNVRLAMKMNGKTLYYHYNAHGDVVALTDEAGKVVAEYGYDAWGNVLKSEATTEEAKANPYGYAGYTYDKEIEQYYLMARYYEPEQGVFTTVDPDPGDEDDPQTMNGYNYVGNNPVNKIDPDGEFWQYVTAAGVGAVVGAGRYYIGNKLRGKKSTWKGAGKAALKGAGKGLMWTGAGRVLGFVSKGKAIFRVVKTKRLRKNAYQYARHATRLIKKPVKHLKKTPVRRLKGIKKARKRSTKVKLIRMSNAIQRYK